MTTVWRSIRISSLNHYAVTNCSCARALEARLGGAAGLLRGSLVVVRSGSPMLVQVLGGPVGGTGATDRSRRTTARVVASGRGAGLRERAGVVAVLKTRCGRNDHFSATTGARWFASVSRVGCGRVSRHAPFRLFLFPPGRRNRSFAAAPTPPEGTVVGLSERRHRSTLLSSARAGPRQGLGRSRALDARARRGG